MCTHVPAHVRPPARVRARALVHVLANACAHAHARACVYVSAHVRAPAPARVRAGVSVHARAHRQSLDGRLSLSGDSRILWRKCSGWVSDIKHYC